MPFRSESHIFISFSCEWLSTLLSAINELFRTHMFQISLTFHGGIEGIGYEWGSPSHGRANSPDHKAQDQVSSSFSYVGGSFKGVKPYRYGKMNIWLYAVRGGMEDWAYAGSWDSRRMKVCTPKTYGGYPKSKTQYNGSVLRACNLLVEISRKKKPPNSILGTNRNVLSRTTRGNGHVSRNIRLALTSVDLVEPYSVIQQVNSVRLSDDIVPLASRGGRSCSQTKRIQVPSPRRSSSVNISWLVGGGITIDETKLWHAKWGDLPSGIDCISQPNINDVQSKMKQGSVVGGGSGKKQTTRFAPKSSTKGKYTGSIDVSQYLPGEEIAVIVSAQLDSSWGAKMPGVVKPDVAPQTHLANARTNPNWRHTNSGKLIQGRLDWFSIPVTLVIGADGAPTTVEVSKRQSKLGIDA